MVLINCTICLELLEHDVARDEHPVLHPFYGETQLKDHIRDHFKDAYKAELHGVQFLPEVLVQGFTKISVWATMEGHVEYAHQATHYYVGELLKLYAEGYFN